VIAACAVNENVDTLESFEYHLLRGFKTLLVEHIRFDGETFGQTLSGEACAEFRRDIATQIENRDFRPVTEHIFGHRRAEHPRRTGYHHDLTFDSTAFSHF
jgi:hypothetical protein